jgi:hypothetical protein
VKTTSNMRENRSRHRAGLGGFFAIVVLVGVAVFGYHIYRNDAADLPKDRLGEATSSPNSTPPSQQSAAPGQ